MRIQILDLKEQYNSIKTEVDSAIKKVVDNQGFILGEDVHLLEEEVAKYCGAKHAAGVASGTDALILALKAMGVKDGDEIITSPFTFIATAEAISILGARPIFADIDARTFNIDPAQIDSKITKKTKVIIPVHLYGQCADMDPILEVARKRGIKVLEDCAQAIGASYKGRQAGSMGNAGAFSFFPGKNLGAFGDAGMVVTNDKELAEKVKILRVHGSAVRYVHSEIGTNSRLDTIQAAVLRVKLRHLNDWLDARRRNAKYYNDNLKGLPLILPFVPDYNIHTYHLYVLRVKNDLDKLMAHLVNKEIEARTYYPIPVHLQECYASLGYKKGSFAVAETAAHQTFSVAVYPELKTEEMDYVISAIKEFFGK